MLAEWERVSGYDVVVCRDCGFGFADNVPSQEEYDRYYRRAGKHVQPQGPPNGLRAIHEQLFEFLSGVIEDHRMSARKERLEILDVGCATGHFLSLLRSRGFARVSGVEPSESARRVARDLYGLERLVGTFDELPRGARYDLVVLSGVLEHVAGLSGLLPRVAELMAPQGLLFVLVPDAEKFSEGSSQEPFLEFAMEHINFFTATSLGALLARHGIGLRRFLSRSNGHYGNWNLMVVAGKGGEPRQAGATADEAGRLALKRYIGLSGERLDAVRSTIRPVVAARTPLAIWGAGSLTSRLLASTELSQANIVAIVDRNEGLHGLQLLAKRIEPPEVLSGKDWTVLVASYVFGEEIRAELREMLVYGGEILTLGPGPASAPGRV